jgi:predicted ATPase
MSTTEPTPETENQIENPTPHVFLQSIQPLNFLSFGSDTSPIELKKLNVLIGSNGSGKSNLLSAISFMLGTVGNLGAVFHSGGGASEWINKITKASTASVLACLRHLSYSDLSYLHSVSFTSNGVRHTVKSESIREINTISKDMTFLYYNNVSNTPVVWSHNNNRHINISEELRYSSSSPRSQTESSSSSSSNRYNGLDYPGFDLDQSVLSQLNDPLNYSVLTYVASIYRDSRIYHNRYFGITNPFHREQQTGLGSDRLDENFDNLALFLTKIKSDISSKKALIDGMKEFYEGFDDIEIRPEGQSLQVLFQENGFFTPGIRMSDGTVNYLCLLAILCDPKPPRLICIEEPELGLHPDIIPSLAKLLLKASERTQLIITTHSDILIECFSEHPEYVMVCEKHEGQTKINRLDPDEMKVWLERYKSLRELWTRGHIGGNRW